MSINYNGRTHLSASERREKALLTHIRELEILRTEYFRLLSFLIQTNGGSYTITKEALMATPKQVIQGEIDVARQGITYTFIDSPPEPPKLIIP